MSDFQISKLHIYSYGTVAENKKLDSKTVFINPDETFPFTDGELTTHTEKQSATGFNQDGSAYQENVLATNTLECTWLPFAPTNQVTAPDVRRGERVAIYQFGNSPKYYWTTLGWDLHLRKLETVIYAFSATTDESAGVDADHYYFFEISTHKKVVHFHTSQANGEPFGYDVQFDTEKGVFTLTDTVGNHILLNSPDTQLYFENQNGTSLELIKNDLNAIVPGNTTVKTTGNTTVYSEGNSEVNTQGNCSIITKGINKIEGTKNIMIGPLNLSVKDAGDGRNTVQGTLEIDKAIIQNLEVANPIQAPGIEGWSRGVT